MCQGAADHFINGNRQVGHNAPERAVGKRACRVHGVDPSLGPTRSAHRGPQTTRTPMHACRIGEDELLPPESNASSASYRSPKSSGEDTTTTQLCTTWGPSSRLLLCTLGLGCGNFGLHAQRGSCSVSAFRDQNIAEYSRSVLRLPVGPMMDLAAERWGAVGCEPVLGALHAEHWAPCTQTVDSVHCSCFDIISTRRLVGCSTAGCQPVLAAQNTSKHAHLHGCSLRGERSAGGIIYSRCLSRGQRRSPSLHGARGSVCMVAGTAGGGNTFHCIEQVKTSTHLHSAVTCPYLNERRVLAQQQKHTRQALLEIPVVKTCLLCGLHARCTKLVGDALIFGGLGGHAAGQVNCHARTEQPGRPTLFESGRVHQGMTAGVLRPCGHCSRHGISCDTVAPSLHKKYSHIPRGASHRPFKA